jgi:putative drug exporter of the RND superfamily
VDAATGSYAQGRRISPPAPGFAGPSGDWLQVISPDDPNSRAGQRLVHAIRATPGPGTRLVGGNAATLADTRNALGRRLPWAGAIIVLSMLILLFLFTGSLVVPIQAAVLAILSLTASFGAMVWIFQEGHLRGLVGAFTVTGQLEITTPILMFCIAFGLSMDYEVFLLSRVREEYLRDRGMEGAIVAGAARTGRLISAAALIVTIVLGALGTSGLTLLKMLGVGLALAVLVDATLVRGILVPATMRLLGDANWWAPGPLRRLHRRLGLTDG